MCLSQETDEELRSIDPKLISKNSAFYQIVKHAIDKMARPYIFYCGIGRLVALDGNKICIDQQLRQRIEKFQLNFYILEPLSTYLSDADRVKWHSEYDLKTEEQVRANELDSIEEYAIKNNLKSVYVNSAEHNIRSVYGKKYNKLNLRTRIMFWPFNSKGFDSSFKPDKICKKFWCGNKRYTEHRHLIASYMISTVPREMLNLSWFSESNLNNLCRKKINELDSRAHNIISGIEQLEKVSPLTFGVDIKTKISVNGNYDIPFKFQLSHESYSESFCVVVTETRFFQNTSIISEKFVNAVLNNRFFIIAGPPNTLKYLKKFGVKTFDKWIDEGYDEEFDHMRRLSKILDVIDYINSKDIEELKLIYEEMRDVITYNHNLFLMYETLSQRGQLQKIAFE